jgi:hypothetical protein
MHSGIAEYGEAMTAFEFSDRMSSNVLELQVAETPVVALGTKLRCPHCRTESVLDQQARFDDSIVCDICGVESEYRQLHETWCATRRPMLSSILAGMTLGEDKSRTSARLRILQLLDRPQGDVRRAAARRSR